MSHRWIGSFAKARGSAARRLYRGAAATLLLAAVGLSGDHRLPAADPKPPLVAPTDPLTPAEQLKKFRLPPGFVIELVAAEPEIRKPMNIAFDAQGRLFVTQSVEYPFPVDEAAAGPDGKKPIPRDTIRILEDTNGDGLPDATRVFADRLNIPIGVTPLPDRVLGYSIPHISVFFDRDGDGVADERKPLYPGFGFRDTHGMASSFTPWLDGWVYACHGFSNTSSVKGADGHEVAMQSGNTYRFLADGSHIEQFTWGQVNPFGMAFDDLGNCYTADCHSKPLTMLLRGAYYPSFGKPHDGLGYGPEMIGHTHDSTGICGVAFYGDTHFPPAYRDTIFICNPVTGRINHDRLQPSGSTLRAVEQPDFLTCDDYWFRPVDIKLGPDGALYIADFYNRIIGHYEVPLTHPQRDRERGRIWRVRYTGGDGTKARAVPNLRQLDANGLAAVLQHDNIGLRTHAVHELVHRGKETAVPAVRKAWKSGAEFAHTRAYGLWVLARLKASDPDWWRTILGDESPLVRVHAVKATARYAAWDGAALIATQNLLRERLTDRDPFVRRAAVATLGEQGAEAALPELLGLWKSTPADDPQLVHTIKIAVRDILKRSGDVAAQLDQLTRANVPEDRVERLASAVLGIRNEGSADWVLRRLLIPSDKNVVPMNKAMPAEWLHYAVRYLPAADLELALEHLVTALRARPVDSIATSHRTIARALQDRGAKFPERYRLALRHETLSLLKGETFASIRPGLDLAREARDPALAAAIEEWLDRTAKSADDRVLVLEALCAVDANRGTARTASLLAAETLNPEARQRLLELVAPLNVPQSRDLIIAELKQAPERSALALGRHLANSREGATRLLEAVEKGTVGAWILQDTSLTTRLDGLKQAELSSRRKALVANLPAADEKIKRLLADRKQVVSATPGVAERGKVVYEKTCAACHVLGPIGKKIGPQLDGIGLRGLDRVLEDVLDPNRNVDQAFRATTILTKQGQVVSGLLLDEAGEVVTLANEKGQPIRVAKGDVDERRTLNLSPMPANIAEQLPPGEIADLLAYLLSHTVKPSGQ